MKLDLNTKGIEEFMERIVHSGKDIDAIADMALVEGAKVIEPTMKELAPKDTLNLEEKIETYGPTTDTNIHKIEIGLIKGKIDEETLRYGNAQEFGTSSMAAHPFSRPTAMMKSREVKKIIKKVIKEEAFK